MHKRTIIAIAGLLAVVAQVPAQQVYTSTGSGHVLHGNGSYCVYDTLRSANDTLFMDLAQTSDGRLFGACLGPSPAPGIYEIDTLTGAASLYCAGGWTIPTGPLGLVGLNASTLVYIRD